MASVADIIGWLDVELEAPAYSDYGPNGLQIPGITDVDAVSTGVSANLEWIERALATGAGLLLVHHGLFWDFHPRALSPALARRVKAVLASDANLAAYHLPLDAHPEHGNNALLARALDAASHVPFAPHKGRAIGRIATLPGDGVDIEELIERVTSVCEREPLTFPFGPDRIRRVGIVSGGATSSLQDAIAAGCDAFITGEAAEHVMGDARDAGIHFLAAGHYATETFGIRRLGTLVAERFGVEHHWVDVPNPV